jgi:hypothetical protein
MAKKNIKNIDNYAEGAKNLNYESGTLAVRDLIKALTKPNNGKAIEAGADKLQAIDKKSRE